MTPELLSTLRPTYSHPRLSTYVPSLFVRFSGGRYWVSDWAGHLFSTQFPSVIAEAARLESQGQGLVRELIENKPLEIEDITLEDLL